MESPSQPYGELSGDAGVGSALRLRAAQVRQLYAQSRPGIWAAMGAALVLVVALWDVLPAWKLLLWAGLFLPLQSARQALLAAFRKATPTEQDTPLWGNRFLLGSAATAFLWGMAGVFLFPPGRLFHQSFLGLVLAGVAASTTIAHAPLKACYLSSILLVVVPLLLRLLYEGGEIPGLMAFAGFGLVAALLGVGGSVNKQLTTSLKLGFEKDALLRSLTESQDNLETQVARRTKLLAQTNASLKTEIAERTRVEAALRESEELYRVLVEHANEGIFLSREGIPVFVNKMCCDLTGRSEEELLSAPFFDLIHPDDRGKVLERYEKRQMGDGTPYSYSFRILARDGTTKWVHLNSALLNWKGEKAVLGMLADITERVVAQESMAAERRRFQILVDNAPFGMVMIDKDGTFVYANAKFTEILGYDLKDVPSGKEWFTKAYPDPSYRKEVIRTWLDDVSEAGSGVPRPKTFSVTCKDGSRKTIDFIPVQLENGEHLMACRDITELQRSQDALRHSENRLRAIVEHSTNLFYSHDTNHLLTYVSPRTREFLNCEPEEALIRWTEFATDNPINLHAVEATQRAIDTGRRQPPYLIELQGKKGRKILVEVNESPVVVDGKTEAIVGCLTDITERKMVQDALEESEERFRTIFEGAQDGILAVDPETRRAVFVNESMCRLTGYDRDELLELSVDDIHPHEHLPKVLEKFFGLLGGEISIAREVPVLRKDRTVLYCDITTGFSQSGGRQLFFGFFRDVTDQKEAQEALRESEQRLELALTGADLGLWDWNVETGEVLFSRRWAEIMGYDLEELDPHVRFWENLLHPDDAPGVIRALKAHLDGETPAYETEHRLKSKTGDWVWVLDRGKVVGRDRQGNPIRAVGTHLDITARKSADLALRRSEEKYRKILETIADGYHEVDLVGNLTLVNDSLCEILGYPREELLGMSYRQFMDEHNAQAISQAYNDVFRSGDPNPEFSYQMFRKDGTRRDVSVSIALIRDSEGKPQGFHGILRDISERMQLEEQLRQAVKMEAIGRLAGGIAHDFNNLLTAIIGYTSILNLEMPEQTPMKSKLDQIGRAAGMAADLTRQLLAFSRKQILEVRVINLNELVGDIENMLRRLIGEDIELITVLAPDIGNVRADQTQLEQIVVNLAVNARDAMPTGGILTIETTDVFLDERYCSSHAEVRPGKYVLLCISDTGHGMDPETLDRVFDPFFTTKELGAGTGLGLSTVYGIIKQHGGHVAVFSESGHGSAFKIYLPRVAESLNGQPKVGEDEERPHGTETILLVEDEETVGDLATEALELLGYAVLRASSPTEAIAVSATHGGRIHLLLTDVVLPEMDGKSLYEKLASSRPDMKVLFVSGYTENFIVDRGILHPEVRFLAKPFTLDALARKVRASLERD